MSSRVLLIFAVCFTVASMTPEMSWGWGASGHRLIGRLAIAALPADLPAFLRSSAAIEAAGELAREPDRWKDAGRSHNSDRDPAHFLDLGDDGRLAGGPSLTNLPPTRAQFDTALRAVGSDSWRAGFLPYAIIDSWQQLTKDFAYWRAETAAGRKRSSPAHEAWMAEDAERREALILRDLGVMAHYVGDGSQPLHVTTHFNGWGPGPNPEGFTTEKIHAWFEGAFVRDSVDPAAVRADMHPYAACRCALRERVEAYLTATNAEVGPLYRLYRDGGFQAGDRRGAAFTALRLAKGADALRDLIADAWRDSAEGDVGFPAVKVADVVAGRIDPFDSLYGLD